MRFFLCLLLTALALVSCQKPPAPPAASPNAKHYPIRGTVVALDRAAKKATIKHDDIEGYMPGMTMEFPIRADWAWEKLTPGATIQGDLVVDNQGPEPFWIENLVIQASPDPGQADVPANPKFAHPGSQVPDFTLTNQDGKPVSMHDFKGKAVAITFIYARCPLPDYCTRMSTNFSNAAMQLANDPNKDKIRLLTISFDPANDTPAKLKAYGIGYMNNNKNYNFDIWQLAVGKDAEVKRIADFFGMEYHTDENDKAKINHTLVTAVIDPTGKVTRIFTGNSWTTAQLLDELKSAAAK